MSFLLRMRPIANVMFLAVRLPLRFVMTAPFTVLFREHVFFSFQNPKKIVALAMFVSRLTNMSSSRFINPRAFNSVIARDDA